MTDTGQVLDRRRGSTIGNGAGPATGERAGSRGRRIAFVVVMTSTVLFLLLVRIFGLMELVLMWLPDETLLGMIDDLEPADMVHRSHYFVSGILSLTVVAAAAVQLRRPARRVASMLLVVGMILMGTVLYALSGTLGEWLVEEGVVLVVVLVAAALHPQARDFARWPRLDSSMGRLVGVAAVPWGAFGLRHAWLQLQSTSADVHGVEEHWATAALLAGTIVLAGLLGASDHAGWRLPAWAAALGSVAYGVHSLAFPDFASGASTVWALAAILWGVGFAVAAVQRSRGSRTGGV